MTLDELLANRDTGLRWLIHGCGFDHGHATHLIELLAEERHVPGGLVDARRSRSDAKGRRAAGTQPPDRPTAPGQVGHWPLRRDASAAQGPTSTPAVGPALTADRRRSQAREVLRCAWWTILAWHRCHRGTVPSVRPTWTEPKPRLNDTWQADRAAERGDG